MAGEVAGKLGRPAADWGACGQSCSSPLYLAAGGACGPAADSGRWASAQLAPERNQLQSAFCIVNSALLKQRTFQAARFSNERTAQCADCAPQTVCGRQSAANSLPHTIRRQSAPADGCCLRVLLRAPARLLAKSSGPLNGQLALIERSPSSSPKQQRGQPNSLDRRQPAGPSGCPSRQPPGQRSPIAMHCDRVR